jgi:nucleotide-binding universal stress UspA family protein
VSVFKHILIPIDSQPLSQHAAKIGLEVARQFVAQVTMVHVLEVHPMFALQTEFAASGVVLEAAKKLLEPWVALAEQHGIKLETKILEDETGNVAASITTAAEEWNSDLILMGTQGREGFDRLLVGSVAERVARTANQPVMLLRGTAEVIKVNPISSLLVSIDGSLEGQVALKTAGELAAQLGIGLHVLHVVPDMPLPMSDGLGFGTLLYQPEPWLEALNNQGRAIIEKAKATLESILKPEHLETSMVQQNGQRIAQVILKFAQVHGSSLIVLGTHGRSGIDRLLLGSIADGVIHHADVPVLLVRSKLSG